MIHTDKKYRYLPDCAVRYIKSVTYLLHLHGCILVGVLSYEPIQVAVNHQVARDRMEATASAVGFN